MKASVVTAYTRGRCEVPEDGSSSAAAVGEGAQVVAALHADLSWHKPNLEPVLQSRPKPVQIKAIE
jgi:hypothetical protein